ncbi:unnamed protein product [Somion occarium]|uniref:Uncharacterized protein n=1 Tax=Somion occarium TaxID=3059160 RepID=A0ABP1CNV2_9APHY
MSSLPSPPSYYTHSDSHFQQYNSHHESAMKALLSSTWHVLEQPPPPSLREILSAYKAKGDGDRDMLLAMLNAKSAEDQRLASIASLHRTMLEVHQMSTSTQVTPSHVQDGHASHSYQHFPSPPTTSYHHSPPLPPLVHTSSHMQSESIPRTRHRVEPSMSATTNHYRDHEREILPTSSHTRKRRRTSRSPPPAREPRLRSSMLTAHQLPPHDLPLSPYSSTSSHSSGGSPRSRESMAIGSLLSETQGPPRDPVSSSRRTSSERSTRSISPLRR